MAVAVTISLQCGDFLAVEKCDVRPASAQKFLGVICDASTASCRAAPAKFEALQTTLRDVLPMGGLILSLSQSVAGKYSALAVAGPPALLWTHAMFAATASMQRRQRNGLSPPGFPGLPTVPCVSNFEFLQ